MRNENKKPKFFIYRFANEWLYSIEGKEQLKLLPPHVGNLEEAVAYVKARLVPQAFEYHVKRSVMESDSRDFWIFGKRQVGFRPSTGYGGLVIVDGEHVSENWAFRWYAEEALNNSDPFDFGGFTYGLEPGEEQGR